MKVIWEIEYTFNHSKTGTKTERSRCNMPDDEPIFRVRDERECVSRLWRHGIKMRDHAFPTPR